MVRTNHENKESLTTEYLERVRKHGIHIGVPNPDEKKKELIRYSVLTSLFDLKGMQILDAGCGISEFYEYLKKQPNPMASYTGLGIIDPILDYNRARFPEASFENIDIFTDSVDDYETDIAFMSQLFSNTNKTGNQEDIAKTAIRRFFEISRVGLAIDFFSTYADKKSDQACYFDMARMFTFAKSLTRNVALRHDYLPHEFTLFLFKAEPFDPNKTHRN